MTTTHQSPSYGMDRQNQIYLAGLQGQRPALPVSYDALEAQAKPYMSPEAYGYVAGGAATEETMRANREAFQQWSIVPRMLRDVSERDIHVHVLDEMFSTPLMLAPIGVQSIVHSDAELAVARAASATNIPFLLSTASSKTMESVAQAAGNAPRWFQLYWGRDPELTASFLARAEQAGYTALVVTLDTNLLSWRTRDIQNAYLPFLLGEGLANYLSDPVFRAALSQPPEQDPQSAILHFVRIFTNPTLTWNDLAFLRSHTKLPIILKGILHPDDARKAIEYGANGIIVSNHGGRQVDGAIPALQALPHIVQAIQSVQPSLPVLFDSGIRSGSDVFKALALGARAVLIGRPYIWGLAINGEQGVRDVLLNTLADFDLTMALSGYSSIQDIDATSLFREGKYL